MRLIVVYPPGGVSDGMARALAEPLAQSLGVPVLVEHRPGAGGSVGMDALARAAPDGHTLAFSAISPLTLQPLLARVRYDPLHAFAPVASVMRTPVLVVGTPAFGGRDFDELIALARSAARRRALGQLGRRHHRPPGAGAGAHAQRRRRSRTSPTRAAGRSSTMR